MSIHSRQHEIILNKNTFCCDSSNLEEYKCEFCEYTTDLKVQLTKHVWVLHEKKKVSGTSTRLVNTYRSANCAFRTHSLLVLLKHKCSSVCVNKSKKQSVLIDVKWSYCKHCSYKTKQSISNLNRHLLCKHADLDEIFWYNCAHCLYKCCDKWSLERHVMRKHTDLEHIKWLKCEHCTYKSKLSGALSRHILARHANSEEENWFKCRHCSFSCKGKMGLERHLTLQHDYKGNLTWLKCAHCSYNTPRKSDLKTHSVRMHPGSDQIKELFQTGDKKTLGHHVLRKDEDTKRVKCEHCSFQTTRTQYLKQHLVAKHVDPVLCTWVECQLCSYKNILERNLKRHMARVHSAARTTKRSPVL